MSAAEGEHRVRLVLHPGHPKCGSSSIQHALSTNSAALAGRGVFVPARRPNRVFLEACDRGEFAEVESWLGRLLATARDARCDTVVVSSENLGVRQLVAAGRPIHEIFAGRCQPVDVVYYIRRQDDWMVSMWQQWGHKAGLGLEEFTNDRLGFHEPVYRQATRLFEEVYGEDRVQVVPLAPAALVDGDLIADFGRRTGLGPLEVGRAERFQNPSMSGFLCGVLARVPAVYDQSLVARVAEGRTDRSVAGLLERWADSQELVFSGDKRVMPHELRRRVLDHFAEDNAFLRDRYFPEVSFDAVFGLPGPADDEALHDVRSQVDGLRDVVAIQMELIIRLLREREKRPMKARAKRWLRRLARRLRGSLPGGEHGARAG